MIGCGSDKYYFEEDNIYFKLKIKEKHEVDKFIYDDRKTYHYDIHRIQSNKYEDFAIYLMDRSITESSSYKNCNSVFDQKRSFYRFKCCEGESENCYQFIYFEKKIKNKYLLFYTPVLLNDSVKIDFMVKEFKKIKIGTKLSKSK